jgi:hypothetical protein
MPILAGESNNGVLHGGGATEALGRREKISERASITRPWNIFVCCSKKWPPNI